MNTACVIGIRLTIPIHADILAVEPLILLALVMTVVMQVVEARVIFYVIRRLHIT